MYKTIDYLNIYSNKCLLKLGSSYGKVRFSDININIKKLDDTSRSIVSNFMKIHKSLKNNICVEKIINYYGRYFTINILNIPYDLLNYNLVIEAKRHVDNKLKELDKQDVLLLTVENIEKRTNLIHLSQSLDKLIDLKVIENNCLLIFS